jgi:general secretion pathway protein M
MKRLREWYEALGGRERRLVLVFVVVLLLFVLLLVPYSVSAVLSARREQIKELRAAVSAVHNGRDKVRERVARREAIAARYANRAPPLAGFLENAARQSGLEIPESQDQPELPHGKRFAERATSVRLRKVAMLPLLRMLERIENAGFPVVVSRLSVRKRGGEADSWDVELGVSAYDSAAAGAAAPDLGKAQGAPDAARSAAPSADPFAMPPPSKAGPP